MSNQWAEKNKTDARAKAQNQSDSDERNPAETFAQQHQKTASRFPKLSNE